MCFLVESEHVPFQTQCSQGAERPSWGSKGANGEFRNKKETREDPTAPKLAAFKTEK